MNALFPVPSADAYLDFLRGKMQVAKAGGFDVDPADVNPALAPHCRAIVPWALKGGQRAIFASFGLHKTSIQIELMRLIGRDRETSAAPHVRRQTAPPPRRKDYLGVHKRKLRGVAA